MAAKKRNVVPSKSRLQIPFDDLEWQKLEEYAQTFGFPNKTAAGRDCIQQVMNHSADLKQTALFKIVIERRFAIPNHTTVRGLLSELSRVASNYPKESAKAYWGQEVYLSSIDKTHAEVLRDISDEIRILVSREQED